MACENIYYDIDGNCYGEQYILEMKKRDGRNKKINNILGEEIEISEMKKFYGLDEYYEMKKIKR